MSTHNQQNKCYALALKMLIRREHSQLELSNKLHLKGFEDVDIKRSINLLIEQKYQSDERFSEAFILMRYNQGISRESEVIDLGVELGFVEKAGAWYSVDGERIGQGKDNARDYLKENSEMSQLLEEKIREKLMSSDYDSPQSAE